MSAVPRPPLLDPPPAESAQPPDSGSPYLDSLPGADLEAAQTMKPRSFGSRPIPLAEADKVGYANTGFDVSPDRSIGEILTATTNLTAEQVAKVLAHQRKHKLKFGEAAVALGLVKSEDVMWALSQQFNYDYTPQNTERLDEELVVARDPFSPVAEVFRDMRSQLLMTVLTDGQPGALCITSPNEGDGKSFFTANLAISFSQLGSRTLLIDANLRNPRQHNLFGLEMGSGLSSILSGRTAANVLRPVRELPNLFLLPAGPVPPNPLELLQSPAFPVLIKELLRKFEYVLVDTPAAVRGADARLTASRCGAALVISRKGTTRVDHLQTLIAQISKNTQRFAGVVMNEF